jgi:glycine/sarcosine N-methyltransferase
MPEPTDYDRFVDWGKRIARESPFFRREFEEHEVRRVLDVGCGTGMLPIEWAKWGLDVVGVDPDAGMLAKAVLNADEAGEEIAAAGGSVAFVSAGFGQLASLSLPRFDAVTCTGNALPHVNGPTGLREALADFAAVLRPGGLLVLHLLNHDRLIDGQVRSIPPVVRDTPEGTRVYLRVMDYAPDAIDFDFVTLTRPSDGGPWEIASRRSAHTALPMRVLLPELAEAGFEGVEMLGSHAGTSFEAAADESVIVTAVRA